MWVSEGLSDGAPDPLVSSPSEHIPVVNSGFYISGAKVVWLIVFIVLGSIYLCGILIYALISHFSTRCLLPWVKGGVLDGSQEHFLKRGRQSREGNRQARNGMSGIIWGRQIGLGPEANGREGECRGSHAPK